MSSSRNFFRNSSWDFSGISSRCLQGFFPRKPRGIAEGNLLEISSEVPSQIYLHIPSEISSWILSEIVPEASSVFYGFIQEFRHGMCWNFIKDSKRDFFWSVSKNRTNIIEWVLQAWFKGISTPEHTSEDSLMKFLKKRWKITGRNSLDLCLK